MSLRRRTSLRNRFRKLLVFFLCYNFLFCQVVFVRAQQTSISPDGRTGTSVTQNGNAYDVHTSTVHGHNAFNSFNRFDVGAGDTANLHLPGGTQNLLNMVNDTRASTINGIVNSYKDGSIGGNVYFMNPHGIVVGQSGVINTGSLSLSTPTQQFMDEMISPRGTVNQAVVSRYLSGEFPISPSGLISVQGKINVKEKAELIAHSIRLGSTGAIRVSPEIRIPYSTIVNTQGIDPAVGVEQLADGTIRILGVDEVRIAGTLDVSGTRTDAAGEHGGNIEVRTQEGDIAIEAGARIAAEGVGVSGEGGSVVVFAGNDAVLEKGAAVSSKGSGSGRGGFIEFSAKNAVSLLGTNLDASSEHGQGGTVLIDPTNLTIDTDIYTHGADWNITADNLIQINDVFISTRAVDGPNTRQNHRAAVSSGNSGNVLIDAQHIELNNAEIVTCVIGDNAYTAGSIELKASRKSTALLDIRDDFRTGIVLNNSILDAGAYRTAAARAARTLETGALGLRAGDIRLQATDGNELSGLDFYANKSVRIQVDEKSVLIGRDVVLEAACASGFNLDKSTLTEMLGLDFDEAKMDELNRLQNELDNLDKTAGNYATEFERIQGEMEILNEKIYADLTLQQENSAKFNAWQQDGLDFLIDQFESILTSIPVLGVKVNSAKSVVDVNGTILASNDVTIASQADSGASISVIGFVAAVSIAKIQGESFLTIGPTANINAARDITVRSDVSSMAALDSSENQSASFPFDIAFTFLMSDSTNTLNVKDKAVLTAGGGIDLSATTTRETDISASGGGSKDLAAISFAMALERSTTSLLMDGRLTAGSDINIAAATVVDGNSASAKSRMGDQFYPDYFTPNVVDPSGQAMNALSTFVSKKLDKALEGKLNLGKLSQYLNLAGSAAVLDDTWKTEAVLGPNAMIRTPGEFSLTAKTDGAFYAGGIAIIGTEKKGESDAKLAIAVGLPVVLIDQSTLAQIQGTAAKGATLQVGGDILVAAETEYRYDPISQHPLLNLIFGTTVGETEVDTAFDVRDLLGALLDTADDTGWFGVNDGLFSSWSQATSEATEMAVAGAATFMKIENTTIAQIADGVSIRGFEGGETSAGNLSVEAKTTLENVNFSGPIRSLFGTLDWSKDATSGSRNIRIQTLWGTDDAPVGVGASFLGLFNENTTIARIDGASVNVADLSVLAETHVLQVAVSAGGGKAKSFGLNGMASVTEYDGYTLAKIDDAARIRAQNVTINALDQIVNVNAALGLTSSGQVGIGVGVGVGLMQREVYALWGNLLDKDGNLAKIKGDSVYETLAANAVVSQISGDLLISALATGFNGVYAVSGTLIQDSEDETGSNSPKGDTKVPSGSPSPASQPGQVTADTGGSGGIIGLLQQSASTVMDGMSKQNATQNPAAGQNSQQGSSFSIAISADAAVNMIEENVLALLGGNVKLQITGGKGATVSARNSTIANSVSGSAVLDLAGGSGGGGGGGGGVSVGLAGSYTHTVLDGRTLAVVSPLGGLMMDGQLRALAHREGDIIALSASFAVKSSGGGGGGTSIQLAGSGSFADIADITQVLISETSIKPLDSTAAPSNSIVAVALSDARIINIAGGISFGASIGFGGSVAIGLIDQKTGVILRNVAIEADAAALYAVDGTGIISVALAGAIAGGDDAKLAAAGSAAYNSVKTETTVLLDTAQIQLADSLDAKSVSLSHFSSDFGNFTDLLPGESDLEGDNEKDVKQGQGGDNPDDFRITSTYFNDGGADLSLAGNKADEINVSVLEEDGNGISLDDKGQSTKSETLASQTGELNGKNYTDLKIDGNEAVPAERTSLSPDIAALNAAIDAMKDTSAPKIISAGLAFGGGGKVSLGGNLGVNVVADKTVVEVVDSNITTGRNINALGMSTGGILSVGLGAAGGGSFAGAASLGLNMTSKTTGVLLDRSQLTAKTENIDLEALSSARIIAVTGAVSGSKSVALQGTVAYNQLVNRTLVSLSDSKLEASQGDINLKSRSVGDIISVNVAGGGSSSVALSGAAAINTIGAFDFWSNQNSATDSFDADKYSSAQGEGQLVGGILTHFNVIKDIWNTDFETGVLASGSTLLAGNDINIDAAMNGRLITIAAAASGSGSFVGGGAASFANLAAVTRIDIQESTATAGAGDFHSVASDDSEIVSIAAAFGGSGAVALEGALGITSLSSTVANVIDRSAITAGNSVTIQSTRDADVVSVVGSVAGSGTVAMAGGMAVNLQSMNILAQIKGGTIRAGQDLSVETAADGLLVSVAATGAGSGAVTLAGTTAVNFLIGKTESAISDGADVFVGQNVSVRADSVQNLWTITPAVHFGLYFSADTSIVLSLVKDITRARIENSDISALGDILLEANSERKNHSISVQAGGGLVAATAPFNVLYSGTTTEALLMNSRINQHADIDRTGFTGSLKIRAGSLVDEWDLLVAIAGGGGAAAISGNLIDVETKTQALLTGSTVFAHDVNVEAMSDETIWMSAGTLAAGLGTAAGGFTMPILSGKTFAGIDSLTERTNPSTIEVLNDLSVKAIGNSEFNTIAAQAAVGGVSVSGLVTVTFDEREISSFIGHGARVRAGRDILVDSQSTRSYLTGLGNLSGVMAMFAVQGTVNLNNVQSRTISQIGDNVSLIAGQNITVSALDETSIRNYVFGFALSGSGMLAGGATVDLINLLGTVQSNVGENSLLETRTGDITITADSNRHFKMLDLSVAASYGFSGSFTASILQSRAATASSYVVDGENGSETYYIAESKGTDDDDRALSKDYLGFLTDANGKLQEKTHDVVKSILGGLGIKNLDIGTQQIAIASSTDAPSSAGISVGKGAQLLSGQDITLASKAKTDVDMTIAAAAGGVGAIAASASVVNIEDLSEIVFEGRAEAGRNITVRADSLLGSATQPAEITTIAGSAGFIAVAGALQIVHSGGLGSVTFGRETELIAEKNIDVRSDVERHFKTTTTQAAAGLIAGGAVVSLLTDRSFSGIAAGDAFLARSRSGNIDMVVTNHNVVSQNLRSYGLGVVAFAGAVNNTKVEGISSITFGDDVSLLARQGKITISSLIDPEYSVKAFGKSGSLLLSLAGVYVQCKAETVSEIVAGDSFTLEAPTMLLESVANRSGVSSFDISAYAGGYSLIAALAGVLVKDDLTTATTIAIGEGFTARSTDSSSRLTGSLSMLTDNRIRKISESSGSTAALAAAASLAYVDSKTNADSSITIGGDAKILAGSVNLQAFNSTHYRNIVAGEAHSIGAAYAKWNEVETNDTVTTSLTFKDNTKATVEPNIRANTINLLAENDSTRLSFLWAEAGAWFVTDATSRENNTYDFRTSTSLGKGLSFLSPLMSIAANNDISLNWDRANHDFSSLDWDKSNALNNRRTLTYGYANSHSSPNGGITTDAEVDIFRTLTFTHLDAAVDIGENAVLTTGRSGYDGETLDISTLNQMVSYQRLHMNGRNSSNIDSNSHILFDVKSAGSSIRVGENASLFSAKEMVLENSTQFLLYHEIEASLYNAIADNDVASAKNFISFRPEQSVTIGKNARLVSLDHLKLAAGANDASSLFVNQISRAAKPVWAKNRQKLAVQFEMENNITIESGALVHADNAVDLWTKPSDAVSKTLDSTEKQETITGFTTRNKNGFTVGGWYDTSQTVPKGSGFYSTSSIVNKFASTKITESQDGKNGAKRFTDIRTYGTVNVNGTVEAGLGGTQSVHFDENAYRVLYDRDGNVYCYEMIVKSAGGDLILTYLDSRGNTFTPDWTRVSGGNLAWYFDPNEGANGTIVLPDMTSRGGMIRITADQLYSSATNGELLGYGPASVDLQNRALANLSVGDIILPTNELGGVYYNGERLVSDTQNANARITAKNAKSRFLPSTGSEEYEEEVFVLKTTGYYATLQDVLDAIADGSINKALADALKANYPGYFVGEDDAKYRPFDPDTFPLNYVLRDSDLYTAAPTDENDPCYDPNYLGDTPVLVFHQSLFMGNWQTVTVTETVLPSSDITDKGFAGLTSTAITPQTANFRRIVSSGTDDLLVSIANKNSDPYTPSQLILRGNIRNPWGDIVVRSVGDITQRAGGSVYGRTIVIGTAGDFTQEAGSSWMGYLNDLPSSLVDYLNGNPGENDAQKFLDSLTPGVLLAGGFIKIEADKINVCGTIQSGAASYEIDLSSNAVIDAIEQYRLDFAAGKVQRELDLYPLLLAENPELPFLRVVFDGTQDRIVVDNIVSNAQGGIDLSGNIFSTGNGSLNVFDGYAEVILKNSTDYQVEMNLTDVSNKMNGGIRITDTSRTEGGESFLTEYRRVNEEDGSFSIQYRQGYGVFDDPEADWLDFTSNEFATKEERNYRVFVNASEPWTISEELLNGPANPKISKMQMSYQGEFDASQTIGINFHSGAEAPKIVLDSLKDIILNDDLLTAPKNFGPDQPGGEISLISREGGISQAAGTSIVSGYAPITLQAARDIALSSLVTAGTIRGDGSALVQIVSSDGMIRQQGTNNLDWVVTGSSRPLNIEAANAKVLLQAATGIGHDGAITGDVDELQLIVTGSGNIQFVERGGMSLLNAAAADGHVSLHSTGSTNLGNLSARSLGSQKHDLFFSAGGNINLVGNSLDASGNVYLVADGWGNRGMLTSSAASPVSITGDNIYLAATQSIGSASNYLNVSLLGTTSVYGRETVYLRQSGATPLVIDLAMAQNELHFDAPGTRIEIDRLISSLAFIDNPRNLTGLRIRSLPTEATYMHLLFPMFDQLFPEFNPETQKAFTAMMKIYRFPGYYEHGFTNYWWELYYDPTPMYDDKHFCPICGCDCQESQQEHAEHGDDLSSIILQAEDHECPICGHHCPNE